MSRTLTHDRLYAAALSLVDRDGLESLSMRKLGAELGVEAASLYHHVESKAALLDGVMATVWLTMPGSHLGEGSWKRRLRDLAFRMWRICREHPNLGPVLAAHGPNGGAYWELADAAVRAMREAGFEALEAARALEAVQGYALGAALASVSRRGAFPAVTFPDLASAVISAELDVADDSFAWGLEAVIRGLARMRDR
jgi:TetR/AcrR family tetracycline transcriptional repressor